jgi:D-3-phosphoglycerate dehydrogenase
MLTKDSQIGVTSRTFCRSKDLRSLLEKEFNNVKYNDAGVHFNDESLAGFLTGCEGAIVSEDKITKEVIQRLPDLKVLSKFGVGLDSIDLNCLNRQGIELSWMPGVNAHSVAELALCYLILLLREAYQLNKDLISGSWSKVNNSRDLSEVIVGIVGYGQIGMTLVSYLRPFKTKILVFDPVINKDSVLPERVKSVQFKELLQKSDAISIHIPLTKDTKGLIGEKEISLMKAGSILVNLSRGGIIDEEATYRGLTQGPIAAAAFDVFAREPENNPKLVRLKNFFSTPHIAGTSKKSSSLLGLSAINGLVEKIV